MPHQSLIRASSRIAVGVFASVLMIAAQNAFADGTDSAQSSSPWSGAASSRAVSGPRSFLSGIASRAGNIVGSALDLIGVRYRWGGNTPDSGLDCSGFVRYVFKETIGLTLPRRAAEMGQVGEKVNVSDLKPGDLVFFNTMHRAFSHVGIYIGNNQFVHSPSTGSTIRVDNLAASYWENHFTEARRIIASDSEQQQAFRRVNVTFTGNAADNSRNYSN
jgi:cell wall-associated NlpC family hydrolase